MTPLRTTLAFVVAPAVPAIAVTLPGVLFGAPLASAFSVLILASAVTYAHAIVLGVPTALVLIRTKRLTFPRVLGAAFLIGTLPYIAMITYLEITIPPGSSFTWNLEPHRIDGHLTRAGWVSIIDGVVMYGVLGLICGLIWWWIAGASANNPLQPTQRAAERER